MAGNYLPILQQELGKNLSDFVASIPSPCDYKPAAFLLTFVNLVSVLTEGIKETFTYFHSKDDSELVMLLSVGVGCCCNTTTDLITAMNKEQHAITASITLR